MANCPVCEKELPGPLPPSCEQCGWDLESDITLNVWVTEIPEQTRNRYTQRLAIAKRNWQELRKREMPDEPVVAPDGREHVVAPGLAPLKQALDYRLTKDQVARSVGELGELMLKNPEVAKSHIRKRLIYEHLIGVDSYLASRINDIQSKAGNIEECLIEIAYTLNPQLPYRFIEGIEVRTPAELARLIDRDQKTWAAGKEQLSNGMIPAWLRVIGYGKLVQEWQQVKNKFSPK